MAQLLYGRERKKREASLPRQRLPGPRGSSESGLGLGKIFSLVYPTANGGTYAMCVCVRVCVCVVGCINVWRVLFGVRECRAIVNKRIEVVIHSWSLQKEAAGQSTWRLNKADKKDIEAPCGEKTNCSCRQLLTLGPTGWKFGKVLALNNMSESFQRVY